VTVATGNVLRVVAEFGERDLSLPEPASPSLRLLCSVRESGTYASFFRVVATSGTVLISSSTGRQCLPCMQASFVARVTIANPPVPSVVCAVGHPAPLLGITPLPHGRWAYHYEVNGHETVLVEPTRQIWPSLCNPN
jgi:hypothetical protein